MSLSLHYALCLSNWRAHEFSVSLSIPAHQNDTLLLSLPSWIPGSYMVRDFAKSIVSISACTEHNHQPLTIEQKDKQTWLLNTSGEACVVTYTVYANDLSIRSAFINHEYAFINGTSAFLQVSSFEQLPHSLAVSVPQDDAHLSEWQSYTSMPIAREDSQNKPNQYKEASENRTWHYCCDNYDDFIDHPLFVGMADTHTFEVNGVSFTLLFSGNNNIDYARIADDLTPICKHHLDLFGAPHPIDSYLFMTLLADNGFGGLEHKYSTALLYPRYDLPLIGESNEKTDSYITFLSLCSHEFFHTWHVKRIKPEVMVNPDLSKETYTNQLWIYEGFTSFYDDVTLARSGVIAPQKYLDIVAQNVSRLLQNAGRMKQSAAESSFNAWTKFYKQDASATNNIVSYYTKGGIVALGLDILLRQKSAGEVSLDNVMQLLWQHYGIAESGTPDDVIQTLCKTHFNIDVSEYLNAVVYGTEDVALEALMPLIGAEYETRARTSLEDKGGVSTKPQIVNQLGATVKPASLGVTVAQVFEGLAAMQSGLLLNDVIIAMDGNVVNQAKLQRLLDSAISDEVTLSVIRDGKLLSLALPVIKARKDMAFFTITDEAKMKEWLNVN
ncbi:MAG: PDZ domain-containing protein [Pseudomonadota bacterium]|nr:PDZ domain-containing protein [Pseudomonadota bacterium]